MKWLLAGLILVGMVHAQELTEVGPATTFQELFFSAPFPRPTYKVEAKDCFDFLAAELGFKGQAYPGDEEKTDESIIQYACYAADLSEGEVPSYVFDFTQTLQNAEFVDFEILFETTEQNTTSQYWWTPSSKRRFSVNYYTYPKGLLLFVNVERPIEGAP